MFVNFDVKWHLYIIILLSKDRVNTCFDILFVTIEGSICDSQNISTKNDCIVRFIWELKQDFLCLTLLKTRIGSSLITKIMY